MLGTYPKHQINKLAIFLTESNFLSLLSSIGEIFFHVVQTSEYVICSPQELSHDWSSIIVQEGNVLDSCHYKKIRKWWGRHLMVIPHRWKAGAASGFFVSEMLLGEGNILGNCLVSHLSNVIFPSKNIQQGIRMRQRSRKSHKLLPYKGWVLYYI